jgi:hypothetical protein
MSEHGHSLLINFIKNLNENLEGKTIIEIGTVREFLDGQNSTECFIKLCMEKSMKLITIDMDEKCSNNAKMLCEKYNFKNCEIITAKGEDYINTLNTFDFIYLDGYDYDHGYHSKERNERYNLNLNKEINNEDCWKSHLLICETLNKIKHKNSIICFDDIINENVGKGVKAIPYLLNNNWKINKKMNNSLILIQPDSFYYKQNEVYVLGNGKSLENFDFNFLKDKEWIGCCLGFRHWERTKIYPSHYVCVDSVVCKKQKNEILKMVKEKKCKSFLICHSLFHEEPEFKKYKNVYSIQQFIHSPENPFRYLKDYCSGTSSVLYAYSLGFEKINILGMDCQYVEFIPECIQLNDGTLKIIKTPETNPNYFINDYQRVGDIYNPPNVERVHKNSWFDLRNIILLFNILRNNQICVYNFNKEENKNLDIYFEKRLLNELK